MEPKKSFLKMVTTIISMQISGNRGVYQMILNLFRSSVVKDCLPKKSVKQCQTRSDRIFGFVFVIYYAFSNIWLTHI